MQMTIVLALITFTLGVLGAIGKTREENSKTVGRLTNVGWIIVCCLAVTFAISSIMAIADDREKLEKEKQLKAAQYLTTILAANNINVSPTVTLHIALAKGASQRIADFAFGNLMSNTDTRSRLLEMALLPKWLQGHPVTIEYSLWYMRDPIERYPFVQVKIDAATNLDVSIQRNGYAQSGVPEKPRLRINPNNDGVGLVLPDPLIPRRVSAAQLIQPYFKKLVAIEVSDAGEDGGKTIQWFKQNVKSIWLETGTDESGMFRVIMPLEARASQALGSFHIDAALDPKRPGQPACDIPRRDLLCA